MMVLIVTALIATLTDTSGLVPDSYVELFTYYTLQINVACLGVWGALTWYAVRRTEPARWVEYGRAFIAANLVVVAVIYWGSIFPLGTQDGAQLAWVMAIAHVATPVYVVADQALVGSREPLPWRRWWWVSGYATLWVGIALVRGALGGKLPYDYLNAETGYGPVIVTVAIHGVVLIAMSVTALRWRSARRVPDPASAGAGAGAGAPVRCSASGGGPVTRHHRPPQPSAARRARGLRPGRPGAADARRWRGPRRSSS